jgi:hypothetical protein
VYRPQKREIKNSPKGTRMSSSIFFLDNHYLRVLNETGLNPLETFLFYYWWLLLKVNLKTRLYRHR